MKWIFSFLAVVGMAHIQARELVVITYRRDSAFKAQVEKIIAEDLQLPRKYLTWKKVPRPCEVLGRPLLQICLHQGRVQVVQSRPQILRKTLGKIIRVTPVKGGENL